MTKSAAADEGFTHPRPLPPPPPPPSPPHPPPLLQTLRVPKLVNDQEGVQVEVTRLLVQSYFDIVRKNLQVRGG